MMFLMILDDEEGFKDAIISTQKERPITNLILRFKEFPLSFCLRCSTIKVVWKDLELDFSNSLIIHDQNTKEIITISLS